MRVLFDQGTPAPLRQALVGHQVETGFELGWATLQNGALIAAAEDEGFDVLLTTDKSLKYQQNLSARTIAIVVLSTTSWPRIRRVAQEVLHAVEGAAPGTYMEFTVS